MLEPAPRRVDSVDTRVRDGLGLLRGQGNDGRGRAALCGVACRLAFVLQRCVLQAAGLVYSAHAGMLVLGVYGSNGFHGRAPEAQYASIEKVMRGDQAVKSLTPAVRLVA
jgi:hypothetical protein